MRNPLLQISGVRADELKAGDCVVLPQYGTRDRVKAVSVDHGMVLVAFDSCPEWRYDAAARVSVAPAGE
ncbi:hypothetical protein I5589_03105 [Burkholderia vietnamiensis]|uniref:Uncharacterized protein n=1 Tax=Burkholderia vietnamiensis TaxID=60552 RepID=A0ABS1APK8_BURVI|nr:hypothetical protein [Burkholderia vietnamiensis]MBJ9686063.1 hypothetical protein [Burkholderia vietnamiensis]